MQPAMMAGGDMMMMSGGSSGSGKGGPEMEGDKRLAALCFGGWLA